MDRKRPLDSEDGSDVASKRQKSTNDNMIAQKRAEIAAKLAAMKVKQSGVGVVTAAPTAASSSSTSASEDLARKVAEAKKRVALAQGRIVNADNLSQGIGNGRRAKSQSNTPPVQSTPPPPSNTGGLSMSAHPLLLDTSAPAPQSKKDKYKPMLPKFSSVKANTRNAPPTPAPVIAPVVIEKANPYASTSKDVGSFEGSAPRERTANRAFRFNTKGKYVQIANQMRSDAQLEALKQRIAEGARKAGLEGEFEGVERAIRRAPPPEAEWWDAALLPSKSYSDLDLANGFQHLNIHTNDSPITIYIQHPIPIPAASEKSKSVELKPLMLTKKEQKKMRKQRRAAELQDKRDRIRMGLMLPDAPKVRLANLMRVLTSDAVQDPTRVEAKVRREVAMRKVGHEKMNSERKLTDEQRRQKVEDKKVDEEKKGIYGAVFKIKTLSDPAHRFKVRKNAEQYNLSGVCIFNPNFSFVYVEGADRLLRRYKRLMLDRIAWTEAARPRGADDVEIDRGPSPDPSGPDGDDKKYGDTSLEDNRCDLVWQGQLRERAFDKFRPRACPTDFAAKELLGNLAPYWDAAKKLKPEEEEGY